MRISIVIVLYVLLRVVSQLDLWHTDPPAYLDCPPSCLTYNAPYGESSSAAMAAITERSGP